MSGSEGSELVWAHNGKVAPKDTERLSVPLLQPGIYSFYLKKNEGVRAPMRTAHVEMRVIDDTGGVIFERSWRAIGGLDSAKDPTKARVQFDLLSQHLATRPGSLEVAIRSKVSVGKLEYRATLGRRLRLVPNTSPLTSPRTSPRPESTRKTPTLDSKEKRTSDKEKRSSFRLVTSILNSKGKSTKRDLLEVDPLLDACLSWFERSTINEQIVSSLGLPLRTLDELQRLKDDIERGEKLELPSSLEPECVMELLRQWTIATESIIPLSLAECLLFAFRQTDFQAQRAAFAILATHLPARNFATLRRIVGFFHCVHLHPAVFIKAGIPIESALIRPYWKDTAGSGREGQLRLEAAAKMLAVLVDEFDFVFENQKSYDEPFEGSERIPEKERAVFLRDLRQGCLFLGLKVSEKFVKESQRRTVIVAPSSQPPPVAPITREPVPKPTTEAPESPKKTTSPRHSAKVESPRMKDQIKRTLLVNCSGCNGEMQIVVVDGKIYHAMCSPIATPPKLSMPLSALLNIGPSSPPRSSTPLGSAPSRPVSTISDIVYAPLPQLPRRSEPGDTSLNKIATSADASSGTSISAPMSPAPLRHGRSLFPTQDELLQVHAEEAARIALMAAALVRSPSIEKMESKEKERVKEDREGLALKDNSRDVIRDNSVMRENMSVAAAHGPGSDDSSKGHKRNPSWTHASPSVRLSARVTEQSRNSGSGPGLAPVPKPPPSLVAPAPADTPEPLLELIEASASASSSASGSASSTVSAVSSDSSSSVSAILPLQIARPVTPTSSLAGSRRTLSPNTHGRRPLSPPPPQVPSPSLTAAALPQPVPVTAPAAAVAPAALTQQEVFADDPDAAEIERLADLIEEGRFSDVEAYLLLIDQPQQVEVRARKLSIVLTRKLSETHLPPSLAPRSLKDSKS